MVHLVQTAALLPLTSADLGTKPASAPVSGNVATRIRLFLAGDVMLGRGIDQILPHSVNPRLKEPAVSDARQYVELARAAGASIPESVSLDYVWGDALAELKNRSPRYRIINLETSITTSSQYDPTKRIHYRMHPANRNILTAAQIDVCALANNHVLDFGTNGLSATVSNVKKSGVRTVGAGEDASQAGAPVLLDLAENRRLLVFAYAAVTSGVPPEWQAGDKSPGVCVLPQFSAADADGPLDAAATEILTRKRRGDHVVVSIHWGPNWGYGVDEAERYLAQGLIDSGAADIVWGHSSHHPRPIEVYRDRLILYGCGDLLNDYEGIRGREEYRPELVLLYFPEIDGRSGKLLRLTMTPMRIKGFRLSSVDEEDARWMQETLSGHSEPYGAAVTLRDDGRLELKW